ncbi:hypothetical protein M9Y10_044750 [Tritrichomonas musculus]|uniref:Uncharacterized protein n=1 Tax=Tritrichomonas musculus TaxID=1915356 RepID=A0ABR2JW72_9EUKA
MTYFEGKGIFSITMPSDSITNEAHPPFPRRRSRKTSNSRRNLKESNTIQQDNEDSDLNIWVSRALNGEDISKCNPELVPDLVRELNNQWEYNIANGYYFESEFAYKGFKAAQQLQKDISNRQLQRYIKDDLKNRKKKTKSNLKDLDEMVKIQSQNMERQFQDEIDELIEKHDKEIDEFNKKWKTVKQRLYNKPSNQLTLLYQQEDKLNYARRYEESIAVSKEASKLEKVESREKAIKMEYDYRDALSLLIQKQREEMRVLLSNHEDIRKLHQSAKKCEEDLIETRIKKIDRETMKANDMATIERRQLKYSTGVESISNYSINSFSRSNNKTVIVGEFNEVPLPRLDAEQRIQRSIMKRTAALSPSQKHQYQYQYNYQPSNPLSMSMPRHASIVIPNQPASPKTQSQSNSPRGKDSSKKLSNNFV